MPPPADAPAPAPAPPPAPVPVPPAPPVTATYTVTFRAAWSQATHPSDFPSDAHFSSLTGAVHNSSVSFWAPGRLASEGIREMAERGSRSRLEEEVRAAIAAGTASGVLAGNALDRTPGVVSLSFEMTRSYPLVTLVTMIAPSPDWFVGVRDVSLMQNGNWVDTLTIGLDPYDAGTDSGTTYRSPDRETSPRQPVQRIVGEPFAVNGAVASMGTFTFQRR